MVKKPIKNDSNFYLFVENPNTTSMLDFVKIVCDLNLLLTAELSFSTLREKRKIWLVLASWTQIE